VQRYWNEITEVLNANQLTMVEAKLNFDESAAAAVNSLDIVIDQLP